MQIDINKTYRYRNGHPARVLCVDGPCQYEGNPQPIISMESNGDTNHHFEDGRFMGEKTDHDFDLIEVREPREWEIRCHEDGSIGVSISGLAAPRGETLRVREILD